MTDDDMDSAESEAEESGDQLAQALAPEQGEFPEQPGPQTLVPERGALPDEPAEPLAPEPGELPEQPGPQILIPEHGALPEQPAESPPQTEQHRTSELHGPPPMS